MGRKESNQTNKQNTREKKVLIIVRKKNIFWHKITIQCPVNMYTVRNDTILIVHAGDNL